MVILLGNRIFLGNSVDKVLLFVKFGIDYYLCKLKCEDFFVLFFLDFFRLERFILEVFSENCIVIFDKVW